MAPERFHPGDSLSSSQPSFAATSLLALKFLFLLVTLATPTVKLLPLMARMRRLLFFRLLATARRAYLCRPWRRPHFWPPSLLCLHLQPMFTPTSSQPSRCVGIHGFPCRVNQGALCLLPPASPPAAGPASGVINQCV